MYDLKTALLGSTHSCEPCKPVHTHKDVSETRKQFATEDSDVNVTLHIYKKTKIGWQDFCLLSNPGVLQQEERGNKVDFKRAGGSHTLSQPYTAQ